ncbi:MAG TPA: DNA polymerase Y family protein [Xanthobacteraceae bacterium]|nr:DNA polymerase Y family protein [Xanthobacteraceae bacterium]
MSRIVSVWLPRWPIFRALTAQAKNPSSKPVDPDRPFVLVVVAPGGPRIAALNEAAEAAGLAIGDLLADARAKAEFLQVRDADPVADDAALRRLALWATRYTPTASPWGEDNDADGFFLDITGAAHLFGGEEKLLADLAARLRENFGLPARLAVADTPGAAWALSRFHKTPACVLPSGQEATALAPLPIAALRLAPDTRATLRRLGFKTVGMLLDKPRAPFAARFPTELLRRVDQALGRVDEPLVPVVAPPVYHSLRYLIEPIFTHDAIIAHVNRLMATLIHVLTRDDVVARALRLCLYNVDGAVEAIDIGLTLPTRNVSHVARLIELKLEALAATCDAGFGFEAIGLAVTCAEPMPARQTEFTSVSEDDNRTERCAALIDALRQRLGPHSVRRFEPVASHLPERAEVLPPIDGEAPAWPEPEQKSRPLLLLPHAEPAEDVTALVPDGPPRRFSWRGVTYDVTGAQGPERIGAEWWRRPLPTLPRKRGREMEGTTRDYYLVEDSTGHRFWLFREGLYGRETAQAQWFVHGLFA